MSKVFEQRLQQVADRLPDAFADARRGVEKESLRVDAEGRLASNSHPIALGSALTNRYITTDFSEALMEFVTPVYDSVAGAHRSIDRLHQFTHARLGDELLWSSSMPCVLSDTETIPLARYGTSNVGRMKTIYRRGLGYRYGRPMQTISGVHYNFSVPAAFWSGWADIVGGNSETVRSDYYLGLVRNFRRMGWLVLYLFGASPALCRSFAGERELDMPLVNGDTYYQPYATSLRMSDLGYSNKNQSRIHICLNSLDNYIRDLTAAIHTPEPDYEKIGVVVDGRYRQLNANLLQIENEYYSPIRPKRVAMSGERPTAALRRGGIEYIEVRSLDCNLFEPSGLCADSMHFLEAFLVYCLLEESPPIDEAGLAEAAANQTLVARDGRNPACTLLRNGAETGLGEWAAQVVANVAGTARLMDGEGSSYSKAVAEMQRRVEDPERTPSARVLDELRERESSFFDLAFDLSKQHADHYASLPAMAAEAQEALDIEVTASLQRQADIEASDSISFEEYLENYFASD